MDDFTTNAATLMKIRTLRIIVGAMIVGQIAFVGVMFYLASAGNAMPPRPAPFLTYLFLGIAAFQLVTAIVLPDVVSAAKRRQLVGSESDLSSSEIDDAFDSAFMLRIIVRSALLESATFLLAIAYFLDRTPVSLGAACFFIAATAAQFPTLGGYLDWRNRQKQLLLDEQSSRL